MNRNVLKWALVAAVIIGIAAFLILRATSSSKKQVVVGNSKAFKIEPVEGIAISADENALDKDREFKLEPVSDRTYKKVVEQFQGNDIKPLIVMELDAGLKPDQFLPGDYDVEMDLDKMGIPRELQDKVVVYRGVGSNKNLQLSEYNTRINDGKLSFKSNKNSKLVLGLRHRPASQLYTHFSFYRWNPYNMVREWSALPKKWRTGLIDFYGINVQDFSCTTVLLDIQHKSGNFRLYFRFKDTEDADRYDKYIANDNAFGKRIKELEEEAHELWEAKVKKQVDKEIEEYKDNEFFLWLFSKKQVDAIKASISEEKIFDSLVTKDKTIAKLQSDPDGKLPKSIDTIIEQIIRSNEYLDSIGLHPFTNELVVYLLNGVVMGYEEENEKNSGAAMNYIWSGDAFLLINYPYYFDFKKGPDQVHCTLVHELSHVRQTSYYGFSTGGAPNEAATVVLERDAARLWYNQGLFKEERNDPDNRINLPTLLTERADHQLYGYPLDESFTNPTAAYTLGDAIECIREGAGKKDMSTKLFMSTYRYYNPERVGWSEWIKQSLLLNDEEFRQGWVYFGERFLRTVYTNQDDEKCPKEAATTTLSISASKPIVKLEKLSKPKDYTIQTFKCVVKEEIASRDKMPGVFVYCTEEDHPYVTFYWDDAYFSAYEPKNGRLFPATPSLYFKWNKETDVIYNLDRTRPMINRNKKEKQYQLAAVTTTQSQGPECDYYVVALFAPEKPNIKKVKKDVITFYVPKPVRALRKKGLVSGVEFTYTDKNGHTETYIAGPDQFGKKVTWTIPGCSAEGNAFSLSCHTFYDLDPNTICSSPESEKAEYGVMPEEKKEEEIIVVDEKKGYWKQVEASGFVQSKSIDETEIVNGLASRDLRGIELKKVNGENEVEFTGTACSKIEEDGKILYQPETFLDGYISYTEPPKQWPANTNYTCEWYIAEDPFVKKMDNPFTFAIENTSSAPKACEQGKDKVTEKNSKNANAKWLNQMKTVFKTNTPQKDDPKAFTIVQKFTISGGSNLDAVVTLIYDYEWVDGEMEEEEVKEEEAPEGGGYWKLVKTEVDDSHRYYADDYETVKATISGGAGQYTVHIDFIDYILEKDGLYWRQTDKKSVAATLDRKITIDNPKPILRPGDTLKWVNEEAKQEQLETWGRERFYYPVGSLRICNLDFQHQRDVNKNYSISCGDGYHDKTAGQRKEGFITIPEYDIHTLGMHIKEGFKIFELITTEYGPCYVAITYTYEWVEGEQKAEPVEKPVSGGHWRLMRTFVSSEQGTMGCGDEGVVVQGGNGHYTVHAERDGIISDREIIFEKPKSVYMPGEQITLKVTNEKPNIKGGKKGLSYGDIAFSTGQYDGCIEYGTWDDMPSYNNKKVVGVAKGVALNRVGKPGVVDFTITEYIKVNGCISKVFTTYQYEWEE